MTTLTSKITAAGIVLGMGLQAGYGMESFEDSMIEDASEIAGVALWEWSYSAQKRESQKELALRDPSGFVSSQFEFGDSLYLDRINLGDDGIAAIAPYLNQVASRVTTLDIHGNNITTQGIKALVPFLPQFINLETLILYDNSIADEGLRILGPNLTQFQKLETLILIDHIRDNNITDSGIIALIPHLPTRISLGGVGCFLGDEGKQALQEASFGPCGMDWKRPAISTIPQERRRKGGRFLYFPLIRK